VCRLSHPQDTASTSATYIRGIALHAQQSELGQLCVGPRQSLASETSTAEQIEASGALLVSVSESFPLMAS
jgi:hypothetical protein